MKKTTVVQEEKIIDKEGQGEGTDKCDLGVSRRLIYFIQKERSAQSFRVYGGNADEYIEFNPVAHVSTLYTVCLLRLISPKNKFQDDVEKMEKVMQAVVKGYGDGGPMGERLPPHLVEPNNSAIRVIPHSDFEKMSGKEVIEILRTHNVVLTGVPDQTGVSTSTFRFDEAGFKTIGRLKNVIEIHGEPNS